MPFMWLQHNYYPCIHVERVQIELTVSFRDAVSGHCHFQDRTLNIKLQAGVPIQGATKRHRSLYHHTIHRAFPISISSALWLCNIVSAGRRHLPDHCTLSQYCTLHRHDCHQCLCSDAMEIVVHLIFQSPNWSIGVEHSTNDETCRGSAIRPHGANSLVS